MIHENCQSYALAKNENQLSRLDMEIKDGRKAALRGRIVYYKYYFPTEAELIQQKRVTEQKRIERDRKRKLSKQSKKRNRS